MSQTVDMSKHFTTKDLLRYTLPSMGTMLFTSIYGIVDGFFISNFAGKTSFAAVNLIMPFIMILGTIGFMAGSGGGALISQALGEGDRKKANRWFSTIVWATLAAGILLALIGAAVMEPISLALGASPEMLPDCVLYGRLSMISLPFFIMQFAFQVFFSTAGKPGLGLAVTIISGVTNMVLDAVLVGGLGLEVTGAAGATVASEYVGGLIPIIYFLRPNKSLLKLGKPSSELRVLAKTCLNGSSEMMSSIAFNIVAVLYNYQLMVYLGEDGVSAYGVIMYAGMIFIALLEGYNMGSSPLMSFQHGAKNAKEKRSLFRHGTGIMLIGGALMCGAAELLAPAVSSFFVGYDAGLFDLTVYAFRIYSFAFILTGFSMFGSALFTALGNGVISAVISFMRTLVFECGAVLLLPALVGVDGIWFSVVIAEVASSIMAAICIVIFRKRYEF